MAVTLTVSIDVNSQNITNNTSNVTVGVRASWTGGSYNLTQKSGWVEIDGTRYTFTSSFNDKRTSSGTKLLYSKTLNIAHNTDGTKSVKVSASYTTGVSSGTIGASATKTLTTIPRKSSLTASNGTLGTAMTLKVTKQASAFTHTITYKCGSATGTVCTKSSNASITWTPPLSLASQNTTGVSVSITFTITTYNGNDSVGSNTRAVTCSIPASVRPSCAIDVTDPTGIKDRYGSYVKDLSKFKVVVSPTIAHGSVISKYSSTANGVKYTSATFETGTLSHYGDLVVSSTVTDNRGRSGSDSETIHVVDYTIPVISRLAVKRGTYENESFKENDQGGYIQVTFSAAVTELKGVGDGKDNVAVYTIKYKPTGASEYTESVGGKTVPLDDYENKYSIDSGTYVFKAYTERSYDVVLEVADSHNTTTRVTSVSTAYTIMHWGVTGDSLAVGKVCELPGVFDVGMQTRFSGGILHPILEPETNLDDVRIPNTYIGANLSQYNYVNCPLETGTFTLTVVGAGDGDKSGEMQVKQAIQSCSKTDSTTYERFYHKDANDAWTWGEWICTSDYSGVLLWQGGFFMHDTQIINLAEPVSKQRSGIVLVFCRYSSGEIQDYHFSYHFVPKMIVAMHSGCGSIFQMGSVEGDYFAAKYLYISDKTIRGNEYNDNVITDTDNGIKYTNNATVLRYVIGV